MRREARGLPRPRRHHPGADVGRRLAARLAVAEHVERDRGDVDGQIEPVAQRPGQPFAVAQQLAGRAAALAPRIGRETARARIHRPDQHEAGGEDRGARGPGDRDPALLERLAQHLEHMPAELEHLVEKQHPVVRQADLAWTRLRTAADQRGIRDGVVRRPERPVGQQAAAGRQQPDDGVHRRHLERLVERQRRQDPRHPPRHHRLARARRTDQQQVVPAGGRDFKGAAGKQLAAYVGQVGPRFARKAR